MKMNGVKTKTLQLVLVIVCYIFLRVLTLALYPMFIKTIDVIPVTGRVDLAYVLNTSTALNQVFSLRNNGRCGELSKLYFESNLADDEMKEISNLCYVTKKQTTIRKCVFSLRIIVLTYNRPKSLLRLLNSLNSANYGNAKVKLEIWIDRGKNGSVHNETLLTASVFHFDKGMTEVIVREKHVGIYGQWFSSYKPNTKCSEIAAIFEDDIAVSPHYYTYLNIVHRKYCRIEDVNGISLQGRQIKFTDPQLPGEVEIPEGNSVYLFPVLGTWGFSPCTKNWSTFLQWLHKISSFPDFMPYVPKHLATKWFKLLEKDGRAETMWELWHIYYAWMKREYTLYNYLPNKEGFAQHWAEKGLHYSGETKQLSNPLVSNWTLDINLLPHRPVHMDIAGNVLR